MERPTCSHRWPVPPAAMEPLQPACPAHIASPHGWQLHSTWAESPTSQTCSCWQVGTTLVQPRLRKERPQRCGAPTRVPHVTRTCTGGHLVYDCAGSSWRRSTACCTSTAGEATHPIHMQNTRPRDACTVSELLSSAFNCPAPPTQSTVPCPHTTQHHTHRAQGSRSCSVTEGGGHLVLPTL